MRKLSRKREVREEVWEKFDGCCAYCGREVSLADAHIDHVMPLSSGGLDAPWNLALACASCNRSKGCRDLTEWFTDPTRQGLAKLATYALYDLDDWRYDADIANEYRKAWKQAAEGAFLAVVVAVRRGRADPSVLADVAAALRRPAWFH